MTRTDSGLSQVRCGSPPSASTLACRSFGPKACRLCVWGDAAWHIRSEIAGTAGASVIRMARLLIHVRPPAEDALLDWCRHSWRSALVELQRHAGHIPPPTSRRARMARWPNRPPNPPAPLWERRCACVRRPMPGPCGLSWRDGLVAGVGGGSAVFGGVGRSGGLCPRAVGEHWLSCARVAPEVVGERWLEASAQRVGRDQAPPLERFARMWNSCVSSPRPPSP